MTAGFKTRTSFIVRVRVMSAIFIVVALFLVTRLYFVQIVHGADYAKDATGQYVARTPESDVRRTIFFNTKDNQLIVSANMQSGWRVAIVPSQRVDAESVYAKINAITPVDHMRFFASVEKKKDPYEEIANRLDDTSAQKVRALKINGVKLDPVAWRFYPGGELGSQVLGFVGFKDKTRVGMYGLERQYQDTLVEPSSNLYINPFAEIFANMQALVASDPASHQGDIITSIEPSVQKQLEMTLDDVMKKYGPQLAGGIIMDPHTGKIISIGARPAFDPNAYNLESDPSAYANALVEGRYELGSIMKPLTMAAGIDVGAVTTATTYNDTGCITRSTAKICNFDQKARGVIPMQDVLGHSLNVGVSFVVDKMGHEAWTRYVRAYGLGEKTGIDLPNEVTGDISILGEGNGPDINYDTAGFGQGIAVSPIAMTRALATLANEGVLPVPHVVTGIRYENGVTRSIDVPIGARVLKAESAQTVTEMLIKVFDKDLLKGELKQEHYTIAAKTGTAQIPKPGGGYYPKGTYLHSFFGYFPARDPKFIVFLFAIEPHGQEYASATLAHPFIDITKFIINYYNLPPDR
jgi:cell division protein FtsI/penicillin-binding protein 2